MAYTEEEFDFEEFTATGLNENQATAIWKLEKTSAILFQDRKTMKT
jgi:hypothetical protein